MKFMRKKTLTILSSCLLGGAIIASSICASVHTTSISTNNANSQNAINNGTNGKNFGTGQILLNGKTKAPSLPVGYLQQTFTVSNNVGDLPSGTIISYTISYTTPADASFFTFTDPTLTLAPGLTIDDHSFTLTCTLSAPGYNTSTFSNTFTISVTENNVFPTVVDVTYDGEQSPSQVYSATTTDVTTYPLAISSALPQNTTVLFAMRANNTYPFCTISSNTLSITNSDNGSPIKIGSYTLPIQVTLVAPGYVTTIINLNPVLEITPTTPIGGNSFDLTDVIAAPYLIDSGTTFYYVNNTSAGTYANKFIDLYKLAYFNGADLTQKVTFTIKGNLTNGLLIDTRFKNIEITADAARSITPNILTSGATGDACGVLVASTVNNVPTFNGTIKMNSTNVITVTLNYTDTTYTDYNGQVNAYRQGMVGAGANIDLGLTTLVRSPHNIARSINFTSTITSATISIDTKYTRVLTHLTAASATNIATGIAFAGAITGTSTAKSNINIYSTLTTSYVESSGESNGIYFMGDVSYANVTLAASTTMIARVSGNYNGGNAHCLRFTTINGAANASTNITISGTYTSQTINAKTYVNAYGLATTAISSYSSSNKTTLNIKNDAVFNVNSNANAYGVYINGAISKYGSITIDANINIRNQNTTYTSTTTLYGIYMTTVACDVTINAVIYMYVINTYAGVNMYGIYMATIGYGATVSFNGIMSLVSINPANGNTSTVAGVHIATSTEVSSILLITGIINIINGGTTNNATNNISYGIMLNGTNNSGKIRIAGSTTAQPACINLVTNANAGVNGTNIAIYVNRAASNSASIETQYASFCLDSYSTNEFFRSGTTTTTKELAYYQGTTTGVTQASTKVYSRTTCNNGAANYSYNTFPVIWNTVATTFGNSTAANGGAVDTTVGANNFLVDSSTASSTTFPAYANLFCIGVNNTSTAAANVRTFNKELRAKFIAWYSTRNPATGTVPYTWLSNINSANATATTGWNAAA